MIPIKDNIPRRSFPLVTLTLIAVNFLVFIYQIRLVPDELQDFILNFGVVPRDFFNAFSPFFRGPGMDVFEISSTAATLLTASFIHGSWLHVLGNMLYLWIFGDNVEDYLGSFRYLVVYILMGAAGHLFHVAANPASPIPLIGASGAIAGVLGAYFVLYPHARVLTLLPLGFFITLIYIPAVVFLAFWFVLQLINALFTTALLTGVQPVAWWAHIGGFITGLAAGVWLRNTSSLNNQ